MSESEKRERLACLWRVTSSFETLGLLRCESSSDCSLSSSSSTIEPDATEPSLFGCACSSCVILADEKVIWASRSMTRWLKRASRAFLSFRVSVCIRAWSWISKRAAASELSRDWIFSTASWFDARRGAEASEL